LMTYLTTLISSSACHDYWTVNNGLEGRGRKELSSKLRHWPTLLGGTWENYENPVRIGGLGAKTRVRNLPDMK
jgi:hypothetical protein